MTVKELIEEFEKVEDKNLTVEMLYLTDFNYYYDFETVSVDKERNTVVLC